MVYLVALCGVFGLGMCFALLGAISVKLMPRLNIDQAKYGSLISAFMICCLVASLIVGVTMNKVGYMKVAIFGFVAAAVCMFALSRAKGYGAALVAFVVLGFAAMALNTVGNVLGTEKLSELFEGDPEQKATAANNLLNVFFGLGLFTSPFLISFLFQKTTYEKAVSVLAVIILIPVIFSLFATYPDAKAFTLGEAFGLLAEPACIVAALVLFCYIALEASFTNWLAPYGKEIMTAGKEIAPEQEKKVDATAQRLLSVFAICMMVGRLLASITGLAQATGHYLIAGSAVVGGLVILAMMVAKTGGIAFAMAGLAGLAFGPCFPSTVGVTFGKFDQAVWSSLFGIIFAVGLAGAVIVPKAIGNLSKGSTVQKSLKLLLPACVLLIALALVLGTLKGPAQGKAKSPTTKPATATQPAVPASQPASSPAPPTPPTPPAP